MSRDSDRASQNRGKDDPARSGSERERRESRSAIEGRWRSSRSRWPHYSGPWTRTHAEWSRMRLIPGATGSHTWSWPFG